MNGAHDLGGMHGFGPIDPEPEREEPVFHAEWERRAFALTLAAGALGRWTLDTGRHARERQDPADYLRHSYYETWMAGLETLLVESGAVTAEELASGAPGAPTEQGLLDHVLQPGRVAPTLAAGAPTTMDIPLEPKFKAGDQVRVCNLNPTGHTRVPRYARGRTGAVASDHGVHVFADKNAHGTREGQHLYSVRFEADALWGAAAKGRGAVYIDLWDDHLEPA